MLTYNRAQYVREAIESVLSQTYQNWELLVFDDHSTDNTVEIVHSYADDRIHLYPSAQHEGLLAQRQRSLREVHGIYIAVLDSDDIWSSPDKLAKQVAFLESHPDHCLVGTFIEVIDKDGVPIKKDRYGATDTAIRERILIRNQFAHSSVLMRTACVKNTGGYRKQLAEDLDLFLQLGTIGKLANIPEFLTAYRRHRASTHAYKMAMARSILEIVWEHRHAYTHSLRALLKGCVRVARSLLPKIR